jgi:hypothetical protein
MKIYFITSIHNRISSKIINVMIFKGVFKEISVYNKLGASAAKILDAQ